MESVNVICEDAVEEQSPLTTSFKEEEVLAELDYEIIIPCVVQLGFLWLPPPQD